MHRSQNRGLRLTPGCQDGSGCAIVVVGRIGQVEQQVHGHGRRGRQANLLPDEAACRVCGRCSRPSWRSRGPGPVQFALALRGDLESVIPELVAIGCFLLLLWASIGIAINMSTTPRRVPRCSRRPSGAGVRGEHPSDRRPDRPDAAERARVLFRAGGSLNFNEWARTQTLPIR